MNPMEPLETLYELGGAELTLPDDLKRVYGQLKFPAQLKHPYIIGNFVTTLDGVASLNVPGHSAGGDISGFNQQDRMVMGLLRAIADAVIVGAGTLRSVPGHLWTAEYIYPDLRNAYSAFRTSIGKSEPPLNVIVTATGQIDLGLPVFQSGKVPVLIVTTPQGMDQLQKSVVPPGVHIAATGSHSHISAHAILDAVIQFGSTDLILLEGGPLLMGNFFAEKYVDELFLTLSPQIAGRDGSLVRPGFVAGKLFAPEQPLWATLAGIKRSSSHLFLRYVFESAKYVRSN